MRCGWRADRAALRRTGPLINAPGWDRRAAAGWRVPAIGAGAGVFGRAVIDFV